MDTSFMLSSKKFEFKAFLKDVEKSKKGCGKCENNMCESSISFSETETIQTSVLIVIKKKSFYLNIVRI